MLRSGHPLTVGLYIFSWMYIIGFARDVLLAGYPDVLVVRALKQD